MTKTTKTTKTVTTGRSTDTADTIAQVLAGASTPNERRSATRRKNAYITTRVSKGSDAMKVEARINTLLNRLGRNK